MGKTISLGALKKVHLNINLYKFQVYTRIFVRTLIIGIRQNFQ